MDFGACLEAKTSGVLWRLADACRRTQVGYREFGRKLFEALGLNAAGASRCAWWSVLTLQPPDSLPSELLVCDGKEETDDTGEGREDLGKKTEAVSHLKVYDAFCPTGCSVASALLRFPPSSVQVLGSSFKKFVKTARDCKVAVRKYSRKNESPEEEVRLVVFFLSR